MKVAIGVDHGGLEYKGAVINLLEEKNIEYIDFGCYSTDSCDSTVYAEQVAKAVISGECDKGILICGTGIGMSIAANKFKGIRCAHCHDLFSAEMTRLHNNSNVVAFGARVIDEELAVQIVDKFLSTPFSNEARHERRVNDIIRIESENLK